ncbi:unnamed protein product [Rotaria sordida]|uniref:Tetratricopeptide repeat protein n=1 Tax=Rotaria sordida TaxID=392033 RepID=A0A813WE78_9BILA|nr:unnamed protein product [Rotaria sordida]
MNAAKQKFEQAITATIEAKGKNKGKANADILNAIGRANADGSSKVGDPNYGIEKLKQAGALSLTNAEIYVNMGILYQKIGGEMGGEAVKAYTEATTRDPKNANAFWHIGMIYGSQNNKELMEQFFSSSIAADPAFPRTYLSWFTYYNDKVKDYDKALEYVDKMLILIPGDPDALNYKKAIEYNKSKPATKPATKGTSGSTSPPAKPAGGGGGHK